jgi:hypothetical protein
MPKYNWVVEFDNAKHVVRAKTPLYVGGVWRLSFDQEVVVERRLTDWKNFFSLAFERGGHKFQMGYKGMRSMPTLHVDGVLVNRVKLDAIPPHSTDSSLGTPDDTEPDDTEPDDTEPDDTEPDDIDSSLASPSSPDSDVANPVLGDELVGEDNVHENTEVIATEEYPLDNRAGAEPVTIEHEISRTVSNELSIGNATQKDSGISLELLNLIKGDLSAKLIKQTGQTLGETVTRRHSIRFSAGPHQAVTYVVVWKRRIRTGNYLVLSNGTYTTLPYTAYFDLTFEVQSR